MNVDVAKEFRSPLVAAAAPVGYIRAIQRAFQAAVRAAGVIERDYRIAGHILRLRFAGPGLIPRLDPALAHLAVPLSDERPGLTVLVWDSHSTGISLPPPPWGLHDLLPRNEVRGFTTSRIRTAFDPTSLTVSMLDLASAAGVFWVRSASEVAYYESGAPLRSLLHWWMAGLGLYCAHAAAVGTSDGGALLVGRGGTGKSTTALACLEAGLSYVGDDYCLLSSHPEPSVYSLYSSAKLNPHDLARFPGLAALVTNRDRLTTEKALLFLHQPRRAQTVGSLPVKAVLLPRVVPGSETRLVQTSAAAALLALAPSTLFQLQPGAADSFPAMSRFVREVRCYTLELGRDLDRIPDAVAAAVREI